MSGKHLVIVESPAKAKTIGRYLGPGYDVEASVGHVRDLPKKDLGVDVDNDFRPNYVTTNGKVVRSLKQKAKTADRIILATDPDREGEAIAWHVATVLGYDDDPDRFDRVTFNEITKAAVTRAIEKPGKIDDRKVEAQETRRILDRLVGYKVSPLLNKPIRPGLSAGRVQTVALRLICEREDEIRAFQEQEYWSITAHLRKDDQPFEAKLQKIDGKSFTLVNGEEATAVVTEVEGVDFEVTRVKRRERRKNPAAPFTTSTLQQEASKRLRYSAKRTMSLAQLLYQGVQVGSRGQVGLITYMRTDSTRVAGSAVAEARDWVAAEFGSDYNSEKARSYGGDATKGAQDAHEAIRPTDVTITPTEAAQVLDRDLARLYELIWLRFVASQMAPAVYDTTTIEFDLEGSAGRTFTYRSTGSVLKFAGFTKLYEEATEAGDHRRLGDLDPLPALDEKEVAERTSIEPKQHFTQPPPRFSEASLVKEMEKLGIGRPSTYAAIISKIVDRGYVEMEQRRFEPTQLGEVVSRFLVRLFPSIFDVDFTSRMESELDLVEDGEMGRVGILADFWPRLSKKLEEGAEVSEELLKEILHVEGETCEKCGRPMMVKFNRYGAFLGCSGYPECKSTKRIEGEEPLQEELGKHPDTGRAVYAKNGPYGPYVELEKAEDEKKPKRSSLPKDISITDVDLEMALKYLSLPRTLGEDPKTGDEVTAGLGRYGPFVKRGKTYANLPDEPSMFTVTLDEAIALVVEKEKTGGKKVIKDFGKDPDSGAEIQLLEGRYGPYVTDGEVNATVPKKMDPEEVDFETAVDLIEKKKARGGGRRGGRKTSAKKSTTKKATKKKATKKKSTRKKAAKKKATGKKD
jgi:DNA topoisomerase-1